jgi:AroM protein
VTGRRLGVVTFGHSRGAELGEDLSASVPGCEVHEQGLLDDVSEASLRSWRAGPAAEDGTVVHQARNGQELTIESTLLLARVGPAVARLVAARPQVVLYDCAGPLPAYTLPAGVAAVRPREVLLAFVAATMPRERVGIVVPSPLHVAPSKRSYSAPSRLVDARAVSPPTRKRYLPPFPRSARTERRSSFSAASTTRCASCRRLNRSPVAQWCRPGSLPSLRCVACSTVSKSKAFTERMVAARVALLVRIPGETHGRAS